MVFIPKAKDIEAKGRINIGSFYFFSLKKILHFVYVEMLPEVIDGVFYKAVINQRT